LDRNSVKNYAEMRIIDSHCHIGITPHFSRTAEELLDEMDNLGIDMAVICPMGAHVVCKNKEGNELIGNTVKKYPKRFVGLACVNPWFEKEAVYELRRSINELGLVGLKLHPPMQGFQANEKIVFPLIEEAIQLKIPIYIHSGTPVFSLPLQILELSQRYPEGVFVLGHMGGADFFLDIPKSFNRVSNVYLETSLTCHPVFISEAISKLGSKRLLFGSDSPTSQVRSELEKIKVLNLEEKVLNDILWENACRLFRI
jgi:predicted TIM-barrel fold metal-dependent hydrolase